MVRMRTQSMSFKQASSSRDQQKKDEVMMELKEILALMRYEWPQCLKEDANPIEMAVMLLDDTSVGLAHKRDEFEELKRQVSWVLQKVVNEHYEMFNSSIGEYNVLIKTLQECQNDAVNIRTSLQETTKDTHDKVDVLAELNTSSARCSEMLEILDAMDQLNNTPAKIENLVLEKQVHKVYDVITDAYKLAETYNLWSLSAMASIKTHLETQSNNLFDLIVSELSNEIYGKSANSIIDSLRFNTSDDYSSEPNLAAFATLFSSKTLEQYIYNSANVGISETAACLVNPATDFISKISLLQGQNLDDDYGYNESFKYVYMLLGTAHKLNRLPQVLEILANKTQQEVHNVISNAVSEVKLHHSQSLQRVDRIQGSLNELSDSSVVVLLHLFGSIFVKALNIGKMLKIVQEISTCLIGYLYQNQTNCNHGFFLGTISTLQKELHSLMINYIYSVPFENDSVVTLQQIAGKMDTFRLEEVSIDTSERTEKLKKALYDMFPGFNLDDKTLETTPFIKDDSFNTTVEVLVPKYIFNTRIMIEPFLVYANGTELLGANGISFFKSFMEASFLPKLDDSIKDQFESCTFNDISFEDKRELFQNALNFKESFYNLCRDFNTSIGYRQNYSRLVMKYLKKFCQNYKNFYNEIFQRETNVEDSKPSRISTWMKIPALTECSKQILKNNNDLIDREIELMVYQDQLQHLFDITKDDFLDGDTFQHVCQLLSTTEWILEWLPHIPKDSVYHEEEPLSPADKLKQDWSFLESGRNYIDTEISISLDQNSAAEFNDIVNAFRNIHENALTALRYDLRCKAIYFIGNSYKNGVWNLSNEPGDCDGLISEYNKQIFLADSKLSAVMKNDKKPLIFMGLAKFVETLLIEGSKLVLRMNSNGVKRVLLNIFVLQQMLRNISEHPDDINFNTSSQLFGLFTAPEQQLIEQIKQDVAKASESDYKNIIRLIFSERLVDGGSSFSRGKYNEVLRKSFE